MEFFGYIVLSLVILLVMVLIHEAGHYTAAKILGFTIEEFSVGFGPKIFQKRRKNGELFSLRMLPLGGYCAFLGEDEETDEEKAEREKKSAPTAPVTASADTGVTVGDEKSKIDKCETNSEKKNDPPEKDEDLLSYVMRAQIDENKPEKAEATVKPIRLDKNGERAKTFNEHKPWKRIIVLLGGVTFNFLSAIIFSLIYIWVVGFAVPVVDNIYTDAAGVPYCPDLRKGDVILAVDGKNISVLNSFNELCEKAEQGEAITLKVDRNGEILEVPVRRREIKYVNDNGETVSYVGFGIVTQNTFIGNNAANAFKYCVPYTFKLSWSILGSFGQLFTGKVPITSVTGPIGSINTMAQLSIANKMNILILLPLLASNLAIFNILPFPALDGARIVFTVIEWIRKKPINRKVEGMINFIGMVVLLLFVLIVDILSFVL